MVDALDSKSSSARSVRSSRTGGTIIAVHCFGRLAGGDAQDVGEEADAFARDQRTITPEWSTDLLGGDGLIYFYGPDKAAQVAAMKATWRCFDLRSHDHLGVACARPHDKV